MRHGSLETGIGMFDYASEMMGWENVFHCEINPFCQTILKYYWPQPKSYADIFEFSGTEWRGKVDVITAGFPCQPFSHAGQRKGSKDDRFIWPENMRIFREAQPPFIVCENVPGLLTIENGMVFEQVCADLENEGYEVQTFIIPACATNKDHRRDRLWIIAHNKHFWNGRRQQQQESECEKRESVLSDSNGNCNGQRDFNRLRKDTGTEAEGEGYGLQRQWIRNEFRRVNTDATDTNHRRQEKQEQQATGDKQCYREFKNDRNPNSERLEGGGQQRYNERPVRLSDRKETWIEAATRLCTVDDGNAGRLDLKTISKSKWRIESLKAAGNTIIWEIAYKIFKAIEQYGNMLDG